MLKWQSAWPLASMLPIAAISLAGQVRSRPSSRDARSPGSSTGAVVLRPQTALTGSDRPWTIPQRGHGHPRGWASITAVGQQRPESLPPFAPADRRWRRRSGSASGSGGVRVVAAARAARRAALKPYRKFSHALWRQLCAAVEAAVEALRGWATAGGPVRLRLIVDTAASPDA
jgi:hypothetical protein